MKKLLSILGAVGLTATASSAVVACGSSKKVEANKAIEMTVQTTADSIWGKDAKSLGQVLDAKQDSKETKEVLDTLGLKSIYTAEVKDKDGNVTTPKSLNIAASVFKEGFTPEIKNGEELNFTEISEFGAKFDKDHKATEINQISDADLHTALKDQKVDKTFYIMLHDATKVNDSTKDKKDAKSKVVFLKITFKAPAKATD